MLTCCVTTKNAELCPRKRSPILSGTPPAACDAADARSPALIDEPLGRFLVSLSIRRSVPDFVGIPSLRCSSSPVHRQRAAAGVAGKKKGSSLRRSPHGLAVGTLSRNKLLRPPHTTHRGSPRAGRQRGLYPWLRGGQLTVKLIGLIGLSTVSISVETAEKDPHRKEERSWSFVNKLRVLTIPIIGPTGSWSPVVRQIGISFVLIQVLRAHATFMGPFVWSASSFDWLSFFPRSRLFFLHPLSLLTSGWPVVICN